MTASNPKISRASAQPVIRQLDEAAINRIAAGEVVERPASAVKELVENALDAGARRIEVDYAEGGKSLIRVRDDGCGIPAEALPLAVARHATSKIDGSDLMDIRSFGFRGEALASLGAVGRLTLASRATGAAEAAELSVHGGRIGAVRPAALPRGTCVELRGLFSATPARLKFLRSDRAEAQAIAEIVRRLAMSEPEVGFTLRDLSGGGEGRVVFRALAETGPDALSMRLAAVLGRSFIENAIAVDAAREGLHLSGFAALPTYSRGSAVQQHLFVNARPVREASLIGGGPCGRPNADCSSPARNRIQPGGYGTCSSRCDLATIRGRQPGTPQRPRCVTASRGLPLCLIVSALSVTRLVEGRGTAPRRTVGRARRIGRLRPTPGRRQPDACLPGRPPLAEAPDSAAYAASATDFPPRIRGGLSPGDLIGARRSGRPGRRRRAPGCGAAQLPTMNYHRGPDGRQVISCSSINNAPIVSGWSTKA